MISSRPPLLWQHVQAKHPPGTDPAACFPVHLKDFDPNDPKGEKKKKTETVAAVAKTKKTANKKDADLDALLNAGLSGNKKKGKK
jgi:hypothetical protein